MTFCSQNSFCCLGGTCDCATDFNTTVFEADPLPFTTIGVPGVSSTSSTSNASSTALPISSSVSASPSLTALITSDSTASFSSSPTKLPETSSSSQKGMSTGTKIGIAIGVPAGVVAIAILSFLFYRTTRQRHEIENLKVLQQPQNSIQAQELSGKSSAWPYSLPQYHQQYNSSYGSPRELES